MDGMKAWELIAPKINPMEHPEYNNAEMAEAFLVCYIALKEYTPISKEYEDDWVTFMEERGLG